MNGTMGIEAGALGCTVLLVVVILTMAGNRQKDVTTGGRRTVSDSPIPRTKNNTSSVEFALHRSAQKDGDRGPSQGGHDPAKGFMSWLTPGHPGYTGEGGFRVGGNNKTFNGPERHKLQGHELSTAHEFHRMGTVSYTHLTLPTTPYV